MTDNKLKPVCTVNGSIKPGAMCGSVGVDLSGGPSSCHAGPNSCEHQSNYRPPELETLRRIAAGENDYFPNMHMIKLMQADYIQPGKPGFLITKAGEAALS